VTEAPQDYPDESRPSAATVQVLDPGHVVELHVGDTDTRSWQEDMIGLLVLGALDGWFEWCGHRITIKTLTTDEELLVAQLVREFEGAMGGTKAYATANAGLCVKAVDGQPMPVPLGEHPNAQYKWALERFNYARRWYPPTIDAMFDAYLQLEVRQREIITSLGKASDPGASSTPGLSASSGSPSDEGS
jgi:hypothetical protein